MFGGNISSSLFLIVGVLAGFVGCWISVGVISWCCVGFCVMGVADSGCRLIGCCFFFI